MAYSAHTATPWLRPAETVRPFRHDHYPTGLTGRASAHVKTLPLVVRAQSWTTVRRRATNLAVVNLYGQG